MTGKEFAGQVRDEWSRESGQQITWTHAWSIVEKLCDAFVHLVEGAGLETAVRQQPETAEYLLNFWKGEERQILKAALIKEGRITA